MEYSRPSRRWLLVESPFSSTPSQQAQPAAGSVLHRVLLVTSKASPFNLVVSCIFKAGLTYPRALIFKPILNSKVEKASSVANLCSLSKPQPKTGPSAESGTTPLELSSKYQFSQDKLSPLILVMLLLSKTPFNTPSIKSVA